MKQIALQRRGWDPAGFPDEIDRVIKVPVILGRRMKLAGEFEFLGDAYRGDPQFDAPPPKGVVKLFYLGDEAAEPAEDGANSKRCGFFKCPWWRWGAFKEAATRHLPDQAARGIYPVASIVLVPGRAKAKSGGG